MPLCLPMSDIEHGSACYTTQMPGILKREKKVALNIFESENCSTPKYKIDENDICAGYPTSSGDIQGYQGEINFGAALICFKSNMANQIYKTYINILYHNVYIVMDITGA